MLSKPKRKGYILTEWGEDMFWDWQDIGGCRCHLGGAPCQSCTHDGHPISLEENDEAWEIEIPKDNPFWRESFKVPIHDDWIEPLSKEDREMILFGVWKTEEEMSRSEVVNKATTKDSPKDIKVVSRSSETNSFKPNLFNQQEETKMSNANNRRILSVQVFDLDPALDVEHSLVHVFKDVITEDDNETTKAEILHTGALVEPLKKHNENRVKQDNRDILNRTGKKVKLEPVKVKNLTFKFV